MTDEGMEPSRMEAGSAAASSGTAGPGAELARQREARGWSVEHVARQLNLAPRQIQALEADNHSALPGMASVRGFIRAYAKLLKIEAEPLIGLIQSHAHAGIVEPVPMRPALSAPFSDNGSFGSGRRLPWKSIVLPAFVVLVLGGAYWGDQQGWFLPKQVLPQTAQKKPEASPAVQSAGPAATETAAPVESPLLQAPAVPASGIAAAPSPAAPPAPAVLSTHAPAARGDLVVNFREQSWIEVRRLDKNGKTIELLASRLVPAGSTESFDVSQPVAVVIGNAHGVDMQLRGQPIDLKTLGKSNVARLTLK